MRKAPIVLLAASISLVPTLGATAQEIKPRTTSTYDRLPAPAPITAVQQPDGSIRVAWSAVDGAVRYSLTRSVPPAGATLVTVPNSPDTVYVDRDVKPGSTYYYLVGAVNEAGITGLKVSAAPVTAVGPVTPVEPPGGVRAVVEGSMSKVMWTSGGYGLQFLVERATVTGTGSEAWIRIATNLGCCQFYSQLQGIPAGTRLIFRVAAIDPKGVVSVWTRSNEITTAAIAPADTTSTTSTTTARTNVLPAVIAEPARMRVGDPALPLGKLPALTNLRLTNPRWISLDQSIATVDSQGNVRARAAGFTHIVAIGVRPDGSIGSMVNRVDVAASR